VTDFVSVRSNLIKLIGEGNFKFKSTMNSLKIISNNPTVYRAIIHYLKHNEAEYYTYQLQGEKEFRIVIINLHLTTSTIEIKSAVNKILR